MDKNHSKVLMGYLINLSRRIPHRATRLQPQPASPNTCSSTPIIWLILAHVPPRRGLRTTGGRRRSLPCINVHIHMRARVCELHRYGHCTHMGDVCRYTYIYLYIRAWYRPCSSTALARGNCVRVTANEIEPTGRRLASVPAWQLYRALAGSKSLSISPDRLSGELATVRDGRGRPTSSTCRFVNELERAPRPWNPPV